MNIKKVSASEILDSRGNPTIEACVVLTDESIGLAAVPSGASTGIYEANELRDGDKSRFGGQGVLKAVENVNEKIANNIIGIDAENQRELDELLIDLDGTEDKSNLGANAILSVSLAAARAQAVHEGKELFEYLKKFNQSFNGEYVMPIPEMNIMNGGKHAGWSTDIQEYMIFPVKANSIKDAVRMNAEIYQNLKNIISKKGYAVTIGDEGGFAPKVETNEAPLEMMTEAIEVSGYKVGDDVCFGLDVAASEFFEDGNYILKTENKKLSSDEMVYFYLKLIEKYSIVSIEDPFDQDDFESFSKLTKTTTGKLQVVGDDLFVTNVKRLEKGIEVGAANSILIKLNQIGTLTETIEAINLAHENKMSAIVSHRSGETTDTFIADLVVAMGTGQIKSGAPARGERVAKYNRLMQIERLIDGKSRYANFPFSR